MTSREASQPRAVLFTLLWCLAILADQYHNPMRTLRTDQLSLMVLLGVALNPRDTKRLFLLACVELVGFCRAFPYVSNHTVLIALCNAVLAWTFVRALWKERRTPELGAWVDAAAPTCRAGLILTYAFAALAKVNWTFLDPSRSCGTALTETLLNGLGLPFSESLLAVPSVVATILIEGGLALLLFFKRTRLLGVALGFGFHLVLFDYYDFSSVAIALYVLFLGPGFDEGWKDRMKESARVRGFFVWWTEKLQSLWVWAAVATVAFIVPIMTGWLTSRDPFRSSELFGTWLVGTGLAALAVGWVASDIRRAHPLERGRIGPTGFVSGMLLAWVVLMGAAPYVGLKTKASFNMYSGLETAGPYWNSVLIPRQVRVLPLLDRVVRVEASSDAGLQALAGEELTWLAFREETSVASPTASIRYQVVGGETIELARIADSEELSRRPPFWVRKLLGFNMVSDPSTNTCRSEEPRGLAVAF